MDHATIAKSLIADPISSERWEQQIAEAQVHALLNIGAAIDAQTQELREIRECLGYLPQRSDGTRR